MARILFVVDRLPFPPRSGVTIASWGHLSTLTSHHDVDLLWLKRQEKGTPTEQVAANRTLVKNLWTLDVRPNGIVRSTYNEVFLRRPSFASGRVVEQAGRRLLAGQTWDVVWCEPLVPFSYRRDILGMMDRPPRAWVATINDAYTPLLRSMVRSVFQRGWPPRARLRGLGNWLRSWGMGYMEFRLLADADLVFVQTARDKSWLCRISSGRLADRTHVVPNGLSEHLLAVPLTRQEGTIMYIGSLAKPEHARNIEWVLTTVWPSVKASSPSATFLVVGAKGSDRVMRRLRTLEDVVHVPFIDREDELYARSGIIIVWSPKNMGLINRTLQAMTAGTVVVGDVGAFNGITGFVNGKHGFVVKDTSEMIHTLNSIISGRVNRLGIALAARALVRGRYRWCDTFRPAMEAMEIVLQRRSKRDQSS